MLVQSRKQGEVIVMMTPGRKFAGAIVVTEAPCSVRLGLSFGREVTVLRSELTGWGHLSPQEIASMPIGTEVPEKGKRSE